MNIKIKHYLQIFVLFRYFITNTNLPSKLPWAIAKSRRALKVVSEGTKTKTPVLKQSGQPGSGAADSSSLSNSSSQFWTTFTNVKHCIILYRELVRLTVLTLVLTRVSASKKTHLENWTKRQACSLVNVTPSSGRFSRARWAASPLSRVSTVTTRLNTWLSSSL